MQIGRWRQIDQSIDVQYIDRDLKDDSGNNSPKGSVQLRGIYKGP